MTQLTYSIVTNPSPLVVTVDDTAPVIGTLQVMIANLTGSTVDVKKIVVTIPVGGGVTDLFSTSSGNVATQLTGAPPTWEPDGPTDPVGTSATYSLTGDFGLESGTVMVLEISNFTTVPVPAIATVNIEEGTSSSIQLEVATFPVGFFFGHLAASVEDEEGRLHPVAQVASGDQVVLTWATSVTSKEAITISYSTGDGPVVADPDDLTSFTSPQLTCDTLFTVTAQFSEVGSPPGSPAITLTSSETICVAVADGTVVVNDIVSPGPLNAGTIIGNVILESPVTINNGLVVQTLGALGRDPAHGSLSYTSTGDGFVMGQTTPWSEPGSSVSGYTIVTGSAGDVTISSATNFIMPVQAGPFEISWASPGNPGGKANYYIQFLFIGIGNATATQS